MLLLTAAVMKGWQLLTEPVANTDIWTNRYFLIATVEFEIALGLWLLSGIFKKLAWLATLACFTVFSVITLYKGVSGAASCGCFGSVQINPWITLFVIDIPACLLLMIFRQVELKVSFITKPFELLKPLPGKLHFVSMFAVGVIILAVTTSVLYFNEPKSVTSTYELLKPETWVGKRLPILDHIDIADQLRTGNWLVLLYHHDCPDCIETISKFEQIAAEIEGNEDFLQIAFIEVPPYGGAIETNCVYGKLSDIKEWFVTTPATVLLTHGKVLSTWQEVTPRLEDLLEYLL